MLDGITNIKKFLHTKGYSYHEDSFIINGKRPNKLQDANTNKNVFARCIVNLHTFKMTLGIDELDFSDDWIKFLIKNNPQKSTRQRILESIQEEQKRIKEESDKKVKELQAEIKKSFITIAYLDLKRGVALSQNIENENECE